MVSRGLERRPTVTAMDTPTVAVLGTGTMGAPMARNLAAAGLPVRVWNRSPERSAPLADVATVVGSAAEAVGGADLVVTMLYDAESVETTMQQARGSVGEDAVWVQTSTVGVPGAERLGRLAEDLGVAYVDAPVLGTKKPAEDGTLTVLASGEESLRARVEPVLDAIGGRTLWVGAAGAGSRLKLACNAWVATMVQGIADSLTMTRELGLDPALFLETIAGGPLDSPYLQLKGGAMLSGELAPSFALSGVLKDLGLMIEATDATDADPALLPALRERFAAAVDAGHGDKDMAAIYLMG